MQIRMDDITSAKTTYEWGKKYLATSTVGTDLIPIAAEGSWIVGVRAKGNGRPEFFLDFSSGYSCNALGYNNQAMFWNIHNQMNTGLWSFPTNDWHSHQPAQLAKRLCELAPIHGDKRVFFSCEGATAVETAIKFCEARRNKENSDRFLFVSFQKAFHGRTKGALSLTASKPVHKDGFRVAQQVINMPFPEANNKDSIEKFDDFLKQHPAFVNDNKLTSAVIIELIQGEGGINIADYSSLVKLINLCRQENIYVIVDEVQTGFYRTGKMFACDYFNIKPDIICLAKAAGGGFPLGVAITKKEFDFTFGQHSSTNGGNLVACASANAMLDEMEKLNEYELQNKIDILTEFAPEGIGLMRRLVLPTAEKRNEVVEKALDNGLIIIGAGEKAVRLMPPLTIGEEELIMGIDILKSVLDECR